MPLELSTLLRNVLRLSYISAPIASVASVAFFFFSVWFEPIPFFLFPEISKTASQIGPQRSLRAYPRHAFRRISSTGGALGHALSKRGSSQSPPHADHTVVELLEGEEGGGMVLATSGDGGGAVGAGGAAAGGGQGHKHHPRAPGLLKSEMSALPSLAGFGMGGSVSR